MYFSKKNKNHMFDIIRDLVLKETGSDINTISDYIDFYRFKYTSIFDRTDVDNLTDLNKALIDEIAPIFIGDIQSKYEAKDITIEKKVEKIEKIEKLEQTKSKEIYINSGKRLKDSFNRYNYSVELMDSIKEISLKEISLPEENNSLFLNPLICVQFEINGETYNNFCSLVKSINIKDKIHHTYQPSVQLKIPFQNNLKIKILSNLLIDTLSNSDKIKIQKMKQIKYNDQDYLSIMITDKKKLIEGLIGIYCNHNLIKTCMIDRIIGDCILIRNETMDYDKKKTYHLLEMNLQNNICILC